MGKLGYGASHGLIIRTFHNLIQLRQAQTAHHLLVRLRCRYKASIVLDSNLAFIGRCFCFWLSWHNTLTILLTKLTQSPSIAVYISSTCLPRKRANSIGSFILSKASKVARTTLCGLVDPNTFVRTSRTPTACITARTAPPAITPVPSEAGLTITRPAPYSPINWCGTVFLIKGTRIRLFFAASIAFLIARGTSRALPVPKPTCPPSSPTTTSAANERFLPPLTTFVTRLMEITWSFRSSPCAGMRCLGCLITILCFSYVASFLVSERVLALSFSPPRRRFHSYSTRRPLPLQSGL